MAIVRWLGPPDAPIGLIGFGEVSPGDVIAVSDELGAQILASGHGEEAAEEDLPVALDEQDSPAHAGEQHVDDETPLATVPVGLTDEPSDTPPDKSRSRAPKADKAEEDTV